MLGAAILWIGLGTVGAGDYLRPFGAKAFDQATLDAEGFGDKKGLARDDDGLRVTVAPGGAEAGWKTPAALRIGGDCTITATLALRKLPKPGGEDGVAVGLAVASQDVDQPDATLLRLVEPDGKEMFRPLDKGAGGNANQNPMMMNNRRMQQFNPFAGGLDQAKAAKPARNLFPARGTTIRLEFRREGSTLRYQVFDDLAAQPREIGQYALGPGDIAGVKLFVANRNGGEPVDVLFRDLTIRADKISGLGTAVRTIFGTVVHGDPTALDAGALVVGGPPPTPPPGANPATPPGAKPDAGAKPAGPATPEPAKDAAPPGPAAPAAPAQTAVVTAPGPFVVDFVPAPGGPAPAPMPAAPNVAVPGPAATATPATPPTPPKPKAKIPLDEVETITFERSSTLSARFLGQPNVDATGPGGPPSKDAKDAKPDSKDAKPDAKKATPGDDLAAPPPGTAAVVVIAKVDPKPNGIRDLHLTLSSLREAAIRQVTVTCQTDKGPASWRLDTTGSPDGPIVLRRAGSESWADLFLEPPAGDCHDKPFTIALSYADNQQANATVKGPVHTDPKLAFDPEAPTPALDARVFLAGAEQLFGKLEAISNDALALTTPWGDRLDVPLARVVGVVMGVPDPKETAESFAKRIKARGPEDLLLARNKEGEVVAIPGVVEGIKGNKLTFAYQGKSRTLPLKQVEGLVLADRPALKPPTEVRPTFALAGGLVVSGRWTGIEAATWQVETAWGQPLKLPAADVRHVRFRGGQMTYLSDLDPSQVEETPYFARRAPYRKDVALDGGPLRLDGQAIEKGLAVHSRTALTYDLDRRYATFEATVGFDDAGKKRGRVDCRVFADGKELYGNPDLRADAPPVRLAMPVLGVQQLKLVVDFGPDEDTGDRVIWANARLFRRPQDTPPPASRP